MAFWEGVEIVGRLGTVEGSRSLGEGHTLRDYFLSHAFSFLFLAPSFPATMSWVAFLHHSFLPYLRPKGCVLTLKP